VNLAVEPGELVVFVGPSGCGKSTLLRLIAGLETPSDGAIHISGQDVTHTHPSRRGVAMVFQSYALYPHMNVAENMAFGLKIQRTPQAEIDVRVRRAAEILQLEALLDRKPRALSGGQRQRVAIGRAIVREPDVFLFDEPLSNLDAALRGQMRVEIARLHARLGTTMIYVTHDQVEAMTLASRIVVLNGGRIEQVGAPLELYHRPANLFVAGFIGSPRMNFLSARVVGVDGGALEIEVAGGRARVAAIDAAIGAAAAARASEAAVIAGAGGAGADGAASGGEGSRRVVVAGDVVTVGIRPECLLLGADASSEAAGGAPSERRANTGDMLVLRGEVTLLERLGSEALAHVRLEGDRGESVVAKLPGDVSLSVGGSVELLAPASACHVFDSTGAAIGARS
jgi:multiple sugar transport system ATP-binding protein